MIDLLIEKLTYNRHSYIFFISHASKRRNSQILPHIAKNYQLRCFQSSEYPPLVYLG